MLIRPNQLVSRVIGCALKVHKHLGPGLFESAYSSCLFQEFTREGLNVEREVPVPVQWDGTNVKAAYRADFLIEEELLIEVKTVEALTKLHTSQVLTYLRLLRLHEGLIFNFNVRLLKDGIRRVLL